MDSQQPVLGPRKSLLPKLQPPPKSTTSGLAATPVMPNQQQTLELADIHLPASPSAWPPAPGWWITSVLIVALLAMAILKFLRFRALKRQQQYTLQALTSLEEELLKAKSTKALAEMNILLRRLALTYFPRKKIASLTGAEWLKFLDESGHTTNFSKGAGQILADVPYLKHIPDSADLNGLSEAVKKWVKHIAGKPNKANYRLRKRAKV